MKPVENNVTHEFDWELYPQAENIVRAKDIEEVGFQEVNDVESPSDMRIFVQTKTIFFPILLSKKSLLKLH